MPESLNTQKSRKHRPDYTAGATEIVHPDFKGIDPANMVPAPDAKLFRRNIGDKWQCASCMDLHTLVYCDGELMSLCAYVQSGEDGVVLKVDYPKSMEAGRIVWELRIGHVELRHRDCPEEGPRNTSPA